jgi:hypothetical protein
MEVTLLNGTQNLDAWSKSIALIVKELKPY